MSEQVTLDRLRRQARTNATLDDIAQRCLAAVLDGGQTWTDFKADAERETGLPWMQIKTLLDERHANRLEVSL